MLIRTDVDISMDADIFTLLTCRTRSLQLSYAEAKCRGVIKNWSAAPYRALSTLKFVCQFGCALMIFVLFFAK